MSDNINPAGEYRCPGTSYSISRAVHLGRLARFYPGCRTCPQAADTGTLSPRQVQRLAEVRPRGLLRRCFHDEGASGVYGNELTPVDARRMAAALGICLREPERDGPSFGVSSGDDGRNLGQSPPLAVIAGDGRPLGANMVAMVGEGLRWAGCEVVDIGPATAACLLLAIHQLDAGGGILVGNASGLPQQVGLKFFAPGPCPVSRGPWLDAIEQLSQADADRPTRRYAALRRVQAEASYLTSLSAYYHALRPLRWVLDTPCAPVWTCLQTLIATVACRVLPCPPGHDRLGQQVRDQQAHFGINIADDGESCRLLDEQGRAVPGESLLLLLASHLLAEQPQGIVVVEDGASPALAEKIATWGGQVVRSPAGRAEMAAAMRTHGAILGGGPTGRCWYPVAGAVLPDALRTLTLLLVLLSRDDRRLSEVLAKS